VAADDAKIAAHERRITGYGNETRALHAPRPEIAYRPSPPDWRVTPETLSECAERVDR
jgi:hypothetical protein